MNIQAFHIEPFASAAHLLLVQAHQHVVVHKCCKQVLLGWCSRTYTTCTSNYQTQVRVQELRQQLHQDHRHPHHLALVQQHLDQQLEVDWRMVRRDHT